MLSRSIHPKFIVRGWPLILAVVIAGCAVPSLKPFVANRPLDGYGLVRRSGDLIAWVAGTASLAACEAVRTQWEKTDGYSYGACRRLTLDVTATAPNVYVAVGFNPDFPALASQFSFIGGHTEADCDLIRFAMSQRNHQVPIQYGWTAVPCRPAALTTQ